MLRPEPVRFRLPGGLAVTWAETLRLALQHVEAVPLPLSALTLRADLQQARAALNLSLMMAGFCYAFLLKQTPSGCDENPRIGALRKALDQELETEN